ncbi:hypothetical protein NLU13_6569 [Sarocladium strictum]|uniref:Amino acid transporter transmembrane domain-containing protein n=1 Tax=Sarocladium strictum TaxID=5046 RepID=A0AA39L789_SARSR|nr:hypothetical protein NLU13_6569 [Sarocladium strictum]
MDPNRMMEQSSGDLERSGRVPLKTEANTQPNQSPAYDAVFGEMDENGPNFRGVGLFAAVGLMIKTQVGLGVLSIPAAFDVLGMIPGIICLCAVAVITTWSGWVVGDFKLRHAEVYSIDDAGAIMFGRIGREFFGAALCIYWTFVTGAAMLSLSIGFNAVSTHAVCTAVFIAISAVIGFCFASIRTMSRISWIAWLGFLSILIAVLMVTVSVGVQDRPATAPTNVEWSSDYKLFRSPSFIQAMTAICAFVSAFAGPSGFFSIAAEMREPRQYTRALFICQGVVTTIYLVVGCLMYYFCGSYVASPALGSAGPTMKKASYGVALPGLIATMTLVAHFPSKYLFVRFLRGTKHLTSNTFVHWSTWLGCTFTVCVLAYLIASGITIFFTLISLIGALLSTLMSMQAMGFMWLNTNWRIRSFSFSWVSRFAWCLFVIISGMLLMVTGTYGSVLDIIEAYKGKVSGPWSCADNSGSV